ncbi:septum formation family protein [Spirillospora sp. NBC_00431]
MTTPTTPPHPGDDDPEDFSPAGPWTPPGAPAPAEPAPTWPPHPEAPGRPEDPLRASVPGHPHGPGQNVPPQYAYNPPSTPVARRTNRLAIAALVTGLCGLVLIAIGLAIAALVQAGRRGERGKGLAVGGLVASAVWCVAAVVTLAVVAGSLLTVDRDSSGQVTGRDKVLPSGLRAGDCFTGFEEGSMAPITALPCTEPHEGEAIAEVRLPGGEYPGDQKVTEMASDMCDRKMQRFRRSRYATDLEPYSITPTKTSWGAGDRKVICLARYTGPGTLTAPLAKTVDPNMKEWLGLKLGDCLGKWDDDAPAQRVLPCSQPHWIQVYAVLTLPESPYPGAKAAQRKAEAACDKRADKLFTGRRYPDLVSWLFPEKYEWESGVRTVVCLGQSEGKPMTKSLLPR